MEWDRYSGIMAAQYKTPDVIAQRTHFPSLRCASFRLVFSQLLTLFIPYLVVHLLISLSRATEKLDMAFFF